MKSLSVLSAFRSLTEQLRHEPVTPTRLGPYHEIVNLNLTIHDPRNRVAIFPDDWEGFEKYMAAQWVWYSMGLQDTWLKTFHPTAWDHVPHGSTDINSNYGQYVWREGQFNYCLNLLKQDPSSRRAVITLNRKEVALSSTQDHICTTSLQFLVRNGKLHLITTMRSNELNFGFRTDTVFFTLLQEIMATELGYPMGEYHHNVGSFHVAKDCFVCTEISLISRWPRYERGELEGLTTISYSGTNRLGPALKGQFSLTQHFNKLLTFYESSTDPRT